MKTMKSVPLNDAIYNYILERFVPEDPLMEALLLETETLNIPLIQVSPDQAKFLYLICKMIRAKDALEIGTLTGYSGIHIAKGLQSGGKLITVELIQNHADLAKKYFEKAGLNGKVDIVVSPALEHIGKLIEESRKFDFIFVDANKESYPEYYEKGLKLSHPGTVIVFDNMIKHGRIVEEAGDDKELAAIQYTNDIISKDERVESLLLSVGDGLTLAVVK